MGVVGRGRGWEQPVWAIGQRMGLAFETDMGLIAMVNNSLGFFS